MSNIIMLHKKCSECIHMSNGLTSVFIDVMLLSGSQIAQTQQQKNLIIWLSEKDQSKVGIGTVGFDICDMPWNTQTFQQDKAFLIKTALEVKNKLMWEYLDYTPNEEMLFYCIDKFIELVSNMNTTYIQAEILQQWLAEEQLYYDKCPKHHTLLTIFGCHICNNS